MHVPVSRCGHTPKCKACGGRTGEYNFFLTTQTLGVKDPPLRGIVLLLLINIITILLMLVFIKHSLFVKFFFIPEVKTWEAIGHTGNGARHWLSSFIHAANVHCVPFLC